MNKDIDKISLDLAKTIVEKSIPSDQLDEYARTYEFALKVVDQLYDKELNGLSYSTLAIGTVLFDVLKHTKIEYIEKNFGGDVTMLIFNVSDDEDNALPIAKYERLFQAHDFLFIKLAIRMSDIWNCIADGESDQFKNYINEYNELRRKILKNCPDMLIFMDFEADLIKYGRNVLSGKPASNYKYTHLSTIANG